MNTDADTLPADARIYVAGHRGMVGAAVCRALEKAGYSRPIARTHAELDLTEQAAVDRFFETTPVDVVILAAARVGGIWANNTYPAEFIYQNLMIEANVIRAAWQAGVDRLLFLGSSCIYPKQAPQPMQEEYLLSGYLEPTNEPYAIAKIAGIKLCESFNRQYGTDFRCLMPTNLYGPGDNFDLESSHVLPALIRKFHLAKLAAGGDWDAVGRDQAVFGPLPQDMRRSLTEVFENTAAGRSPDGIRLWGSGKPRREFLHVDDLAAACIQVIGLPRRRYRQLCAPMTADGASGSREAASVPHLNVGTGSDITVEALAQLVKTVVGYSGEPFWDRSMPDGTPRKWLDVSRLQRSGWSPEISLEEGLRDTYRWYCARVSAGAAASGDPEQGAGRTD